MKLDKSTLSIGIEGKNPNYCKTIGKIVGADEIYNEKIKDVDDIVALVKGNSIDVKDITDAYGKGTKTSYANLMDTLPLIEEDKQKSYLYCSLIKSIQINYKDNKGKSIEYNCKNQAFILSIYKIPDEFKNPGALRLRLSICARYKNKKVNSDFISYVNEILQKQGVTSWLVDRIEVKNKKTLIFHLVTFGRVNVKAQKTSCKPLQKILFGAPGTGKSFRAKEITADYEVFRKTFHPETDYASFVGSYKPSSVRGLKTIYHNYSIPELSNLYTEFKSSAPNNSEMRFTALYYNQINQLTLPQRINVFKGSKISVIRNEVRRALAVTEELYSKHANDCKIIYTFDSQTFADAYLSAWRYWLSYDPNQKLQLKTDDAIVGDPNEDECNNQDEINNNEEYKNRNLQISNGDNDIINSSVDSTIGSHIPKVCLVIEELNRGNCAQIFGDIFQLLDRKEGFSEYSIVSESDFSKYIKDQLGNLFEDYYNEIRFNSDLINGNPTIIPFSTKEESQVRLCLPPNFSIVCTMNTSDQSLFPMDSAFKRRWDWEYVPIDYNSSNSSFFIKIADTYYDWNSFIAVMNNIIEMVTMSEDKQIGNFFVKPDSDNIISTESFVSKVMYYLWSEICKDNPKARKAIYSYKDKDEEKEFTFNKLFISPRHRDNILKGFMLFHEVDTTDNDSIAEEKEIKKDISHNEFIKDLCSHIETTTNENLASIVRGLTFKPHNNDVILSVHDKFSLKLFRNSKCILISCISIEDSMRELKEKSGESIEKEVGITNKISSSRFESRWILTGRNNREISGQAVLAKERDKYDEQKDIKWIEENIVKMYNCFNKYMK